ncbi:MAG: hypothetical protein ACRC8U_13190, partial [Brooklawnia sp.]
VPSIAASVEIRKTAVLRSPSPHLMSKTDVVEIFGSSELTAGQTADGVTVVDVFQSAPAAVKHDYFDGTATEPGPYYYAVSYEWTTGTTLDLVAGRGENRGFHRLSNVVKVVREDAASTCSASSQPPDWIHVANVPDIFPELGKLLSRLGVAVTQFGNVATGSGEMLKAYVEYLDREIVRYESVVAAALDAIRRLTTMLDTTVNVGVYGRSFEGVGGVNFLKRDLAAALEPSSGGPRRPPFDRGDEFVGGLIILATGPTAASVKPTKDLLDQIVFNTGDLSRVIGAALDEVEAVFEQAEQAQLAETVPALGDDDPGHCAALTADVEFGADLKPQE